MSEHSTDMVFINGHMLVTQLQIAARAFFMIRLINQTKVAWAF